MWKVKFRRAPTAQVTPFLTICPSTECSYGTCPRRSETRRSPQTHEKSLKCCAYGRRSVSPFPMFRVAFTSNAMLRHQPGYVGSCKIDLGNPILRRAFFDGLMHPAYIENGTVIQQRSIEGFEEFELEGTADFKPGGLNWVDYSFVPVPERLRLGTVEISQRGKLSVDRLERKTHVTVEGRVFQQLARSSWSTKDGREFRFATPEPGRDVLQAIMPEGKFTDFLFNFDHKKGTVTSEIFCGRTWFRTRRLAISRRSVL